MVKALVLLSGGLDSMLAARVLMEQGIEVTGLSFKSNFFGTAKAKKVAGQLGIKLIEADFSAEHLAMVKNPKYGYGKNMNPCIDCHAMMLRKAREIMDEPPLHPLFRKEGNYGKGENNAKVSEYDFVATGEVLGERPMSQNMEALKTVEKEAGLTGRLIRPLSAKLLDESDLEKAGLVNRKRLMNLSGRSRKRQLELVKKYGIKEFASPGGGCLLTDPVFSEKLMKLLEYWPECDGLDIQLLKYGRLFWLTATSPRPPARRQSGGSPYQGEETKEYVLLVIGREQKDNEELEKLAKPGDVLMGFSDLVAGPTSLVRMKNISAFAEAMADEGIKNETREINVPAELKMSELKMGEEKSGEEIIRLVALLTGYYAIKSRGKKVKLEINIF